MTLLMGSSLIAKATRNVATFNFGYDARPLFFASANLSVKPESTARAIESRRTVGGRPEITVTELNAALERVGGIEGVASAAAISGGLPDQGTITSDQAQVGASALSARVYLNVGPGFMKTLGVPIVEGRDFEPAIAPDAAQSYSIQHPHGGCSQWQRHWHFVKLGDRTSKRAWLPVVGIAREAILRFPTTVDYEVEPQIYTSLATAATPTPTTDIWSGRETRASRRWSQRNAC